MVVENTGPRPKTSSDLLPRVISSLVLAPVAVGAAYLGGLWFLLFWTIASVGVLWEWLHLVAGGEGRATIVVGTAAVLLAALLMAAAGPAPAFAVALIGAAAAAAFAPRGQRGWHTAGVIYAVLMLLPPLVLRSDGQAGFAALILLFAIVWSTDIFAYFIGRALGGPRLWPAISPKKTWSGSIGGTLAAAAVGGVVATGAGVRLGIAFFGVCILLSVVSQGGDLFESAMKRRFGAKDSSHVIPGHGGLMDRLDSFAAAAIVALVIGLARGGLSSPARGLLAW